MQDSLQYDVTGDIHGRRFHRARQALKDTQDSRKGENLFRHVWQLCQLLVIGGLFSAKLYSRYYLYVVFSFLTAPFACRDEYGVLVVVHYYRACYYSMAKIRLNTQQQCTNVVAQYGILVLVVTQQIGFNRLNTQQQCTDVVAQYGVFVLIVTQLIGF